MSGYVKFGAVLTFGAALFLMGFHLGGLSSKAALEGFQAAQSANTAKAVMNERASAAAELARVNGILRGYEDAALNPVDPGLSHRVYIYARAANCPVSAGSTYPASPVSAGAQPAGDPSLERLLQGVFDACAQDAAELSALQAAWPR